MVDSQGIDIGWLEGDSVFFFFFYLITLLNTLTAGVSDNIFTIK